MVFRNLKASAAESLKLALQRKRRLAIMKIYRTCLMILISAVASGWAQEPSSTLSWNDASGNVQSLRDYHGKIVVLNFWATWCVPCHHEMGLLADMQGSISIEVSCC
jgi:thiol-disulfide isomerase/thioredoxin